MGIPWRRLPPRSVAYDQIMKMDGFDEEKTDVYIEYTTYSPPFNFPVNTNPPVLPFYIPAFIRFFSLLTQLPLSERCFTGVAPFRERIGLFIRMCYVCMTCPNVARVSL